MTDYTPTTEEVRVKHSIADLRKPPHVWDAQFDRWLAEHDREVRKRVAERVRSLFVIPLGAAPGLFDETWNSAIEAAAARVLSDDAAPGGAS